MRWEIIRRTCLEIRVHQQRSLPRWSVAQYYRCAHATGDLAHRELDLQDALTHMAWFEPITQSGFAPLKISAKKTVAEFPPSFEHVTTARERFLFYVWKPRSANYPAIDFVIFVLVRDSAGQVAIIALVFQSKYSDRTITADQDTAPKPDCEQPMDREDDVDDDDDDESESADDGAFKSTIGKSKVDKAYNRAKKIMAHVGWTEDKFIYVVHAYRDTAGVLLQQPLGTNSMILSAKSLEKLYGCFGDILKNLSLRCQISFQASRPDEEGLLEDSEAEDEKAEEDDDEVGEQQRNIAPHTTFFRPADDRKQVADEQV
jgi:hypothetical protein